MAIWDGPHATLHEVSVNEIALDQKQEGTTGQPTLDDPVAFRFGAFANPLGRTKWYITKISFDVLRWVQGALHRTEVAFIKAAIDEMMNNDGQPLPMLSLFMTSNTTGSSDSDMKEVLLVSRKGFTFKVPVKFEAGANVTVSGNVTRFYTDHGMFFCNWQDDTGLPTGIIYRVSDGVAVGRVPIEYF